MAAGASGGRLWWWWWWWWWWESENVEADECDGRGIVERSAKEVREWEAREKAGRMRRRWWERAGGWRRTLWGGIHRKCPEMLAEWMVLSEVCGVDRVWEALFKRSGSGMGRMWAVWDTVSWGVGRSGRSEYVAGTGWMWASLAAWSSAVENA
jgi:hypothetical protein